MPYDLSERLVVGVASSALFDLAESDAVLTRDGEEAYRLYQEEHLDETLAPGVAFPFVRRLLSLNDLSDSSNPLVEVIILSRNDPDTGLRVMRSIQSHGLAISRSIFMQGRSPYRFMSALNMSLFLSANDRDVREALGKNLPAGKVLESTFVDDPDDVDLRIAFDFDGVIADDQSEQIYQAEDLKAFQDHETANVTTPHDPGPLREPAPQALPVQVGQCVVELVRPGEGALEAIVVGELSEQQDLQRPLPRGLVHVVAGDLVLVEGVVLGRAVALDVPDLLHRPGSSTTALNAAMPRSAVTPPPAECHQRDGRVRFALVQNDVMAVIGHLLHPGVYIGEVRGAGDEEWLLPQEADLISTAVQERRREYAAGRQAARRALSALGHGHAAILSAPTREPIWPEGVVGSLTHCAGYAAAVVARDVRAASIGVDAEPNLPLPDEVVHLVMPHIERELLVDTAVARPDIAVDRVLFCAKEAVFKAWYPLTRRQLGFHDVRVSVGADGGFTARLVIDRLPHEDVRLWTMTGRWAHDLDVVIATVVTPKETCRQLARCDL